MSFGAQSCAIGGHPILDASNLINSEKMISTRLTRTEESDWKLEGRQLGWRALQSGDDEEAHVSHILL